RCVVRQRSIRSRPKLNTQECLPGPGAVVHQQLQPPRISRWQLWEPKTWETSSFLSSLGKLTAKRKGERNYPAKQVVRLGRDGGSKAVGRSRSAPMPSRRFPPPLPSKIVIV